MNRTEENFGYCLQFTINCKISREEKMAFLEEIKNQIKLYFNDRLRNVQDPSYTNLYFSFGGKHIVNDWFLAVGFWDSDLIVAIHLYNLINCENLLNKN